MPFNLVASKVVVLTDDESCCDGGCARASESRACHAGGGAVEVMADRGSSVWLRWRPSTSYQKLQKSTIGPYVGIPMEGSTATQGPYPSGSSVNHPSAPTAGPP